MSVYTDVTLVIVCFNSENLIKKNLNELKKFNAILIDNSNSIKTFELVKDLQNVTYLKTFKNIGYGKANNIGVKKSNTPYIMILNPDILINSKAIEILYEKYSKYENIGILGPSLFDINSNRRSNGSISRLKNKMSKVSKYSEKYFAQGDTCYDYVIGCSIFISKDLFLNIGGFDENFFLYFEDNDICDRIYQNNKCVIEVPSAKMTHMQGLSASYNFLTNLKLSLIHKISEYIYYSKYFSSLKLYSIILKHFFDYFQRCLVNLLLFRFKNSFKNMLRLISIFLYLTKLYKIIY